MLSLLFEHNPLSTWLYDVETLRSSRQSSRRRPSMVSRQNEFERMSILEIRPGPSAPCGNVLVRDEGRR